MLYDGRNVCLYGADIRALGAMGDAAFARLPLARRQKAMRFVQRDDRLRCAAAGLLLRCVLGIAEEEPLACNAFGKPYAPGHPPFNLAHGGNYTVLAVGKTPVGADVEPVAEYNDELAQQVLLPDEAAWVSAAPRERFALLWTRKESVMKALGLGLGLPPQSFSVLPADSAAHAAACSMIFLKTWMYDAHAFSVAGFSPELPDAVVLLTPQQLLGKESPGAYRQPFPMPEQKG